MTEAYAPIEKQMLFYGTEDGSVKGAHFTFNFVFVSSLRKHYTADDIVKAMRSWLERIPSQYTSNWLVSGTRMEQNKQIEDYNFLVGKP